jgi:hypothetical protein
MKLRRRDAEVFSLSFLDCICCGFGAIILLLVISEFGEPIVIEKSRKDLEGQVLKLQKELFEIRGETEILNREMQGRVDELTREKLRVAKLSGDLSSIRGQYSASKSDAQVDNIVENELVSTYQTLTKEMERLLKSKPRRPPTEAVGGIPVDSEYVIFVIDTSGSMTSYHWPTAIATMREVLDIYPRVKGIQVLDDEGKPMFEGTVGQWLVDSEDQRRRIVERMGRWRAYSNSSPVEGIESAIRNWWAADKRISVYVLGDEFTGDSIQRALDEVKRINKPDEKGRRRVRIHAIGFSEGSAAPFTNQRFSALMRAMCEENSGTFVGLSVGGVKCSRAVEVGGVQICLE